MEIPVEKEGSPEHHQTHREDACPLSPTLSGYLPSIDPSVRLSALSRSLSVCIPPSLPLSFYLCIPPPLEEIPVEKEGSSGHHQTHRKVVYPYSPSRQPLGHEK